MFRRVALLAALVAAACCSRSEVKTGGASADPPAKPTFTVFAVAEVRGQIGPCGCTTDPLGDISRTVRLVTRARADGPVLFVDAGSLLYSQSPIPPALVTQEDLKADLLADTYRNALKVDALGVGPADLPRGLDPTREAPRPAGGAVGVPTPRRFASLIDHLRLPRLVSNAPEIPGQPARVITAGGGKVGVFAVIAEGAVTGVQLGDPVAAGKRAVAQLRGQGAQVVIGLVQADSKKAAVALVRDIGGIDLAIAGLGLASPEPEAVAIEPQRVGDGWLVIPANRGQVVARLDVTLRGAGPLADAVGAAAATAKLAALDRQLAALDADLAAFAADRSADPAFVAQKQRERAQLAADRDRLKAHPLVIPPQGSYFTLEQIRISKALACDTGVQDAVSRFYLASGQANVAAAAKLPVAPPARGEAAYTGAEACEDCHADQVAFWNKTVHAHAWKSLVDRGQQFDLDCIGCHVTGWDRPGGATLAHNDKLRDVQCETCHGPGSIHVAKGGREKPLAIRRGPPEDLCASQCHTREHSDTFQLTPYLRDVTGPGHGEARRKQLGDGTTGAQLRKAGLDKAGRALGTGCTR